MLPAPAYVKATREGAGQGSRKSGVNLNPSFPPSSHHLLGAATLPQGSSFGICKAKLFGDKMVIWKTAGKKKQQEDSRDWRTQKPRNKPGFSSIPAVKGTRYSQGQHTSCSTLRWGVGATALGRESGSHQGCRAQSVRPTVPALGKQTGRKYCLRETSAEAGGGDIEDEESSDNSINTSICAQKGDSSPTAPPAYCSHLDQADWDPCG